jgi:hypothetical protein
LSAGKGDDFFAASSLRKNLKSLEFLGNENLRVQDLETNAKSNQ